MDDSVTEWYENGVPLGDGLEGFVVCGWTTSFPIEDLRLSKLVVEKFLDLDMGAGIEIVTKDSFEPFALLTESFHAVEGELCSEVVVDSDSSCGTSSHNGGELVLDFIGRPILSSF